MIYVMAAVGTLLVYLERRGTVLEAGRTFKRLLKNSDKTQRLLGQG